MLQDDGHLAVRLDQPLNVKIVRQELRIVDVLVNVQCDSGLDRPGRNAGPQSQHNHRR